MKIVKDDYDGEELIIENEDDILTLSETIHALRKKALPYAKAYLQARDITPSWSIDEDNIYVEDGGIRIEYDMGCCGSYETENEYLPARYLFDPEWLKEAEQEIAAQKERERKAAEQKRLREETARKEREYKQYLKLKEQYEGGAK